MKAINIYFKQIFRKIAVRRNRETNNGRRCGSKGYKHGYYQSTNNAA